MWKGSGCASASSCPTSWRSRSATPCCTSSAKDDLLEFGRQHYRIRSPETSSLLRLVFLKYQEESLTMPDLLEEITRQTIDEILTKLPPEELRKRLSPKERLEGLSPLERLEGLSPEEVASLVEQLTRKAPPGAADPGKQG